MAGFRRFALGGIAKREIKPVDLGRWFFLGTERSQHRCHDQKCDRDSHASLTVHLSRTCNPSGRSRDAIIALVVSRRPKASPIHLRRKAPFPLGSSEALQYRFAVPNGRRSHSSPSCIAVLILSPMVPKTPFESSSFRTSQCLITDFIGHGNRRQEAL